MHAIRFSLFSRLMWVLGVYSEGAELLLRAFANLLAQIAENKLVKFQTLKTSEHCWKHVLYQIPLHVVELCDSSQSLSHFYIVFILSLKNSMNSSLFVFSFIYIILPSLAVLNGLDFGPLLKSLLDIEFCIHVGWMLTLTEILFSSIFLCGSLHWHINFIIYVSQGGWSFILGIVIFPNWIPLEGVL